MIARRCSRLMLRTAADGDEIQVSSPARAVVAVVAVGRYAA
jgi:hypothetical protein